MKEHKLVVIGAQSVGKSSLILQFVQNEWIPAYSPTIEDNYRKTLQLDQQKYSLDILDTAGCSEYSNMRDLYFKQCDGVLAVFDICNEDSFLYLQKQIQHFLRIKETKNFPIIIVGNKSDVALERTVTKKQASDLAKSLGTIYVEASAKLNINVSDCFVQLLRAVIKPTFFNEHQRLTRPSEAQKTSLFTSLRERLYVYVCAHR